MALRTSSPMTAGPPYTITLGMEADATRAAVPVTVTWGAVHAMT